jgi:hypothetical protein
MSKLNHYELALDAVTRSVSARDAIADSDDSFTNDFFEKVGFDTGDCYLDFSCKRDSPASVECFNDYIDDRFSGDIDTIEDYMRAIRDDNERQAKDYKDQVESDYREAKGLK